MERADYRQIFILIGTTAAVYLGFRYLLPLVIPFLISYLIVILVQPVVVFAKKKWKVSRSISGKELACQCRKHKRHEFSP